MRIHRFFIKGKLEVGNLKLDDQELFNQLKNVFRAKSGEEISVFDGSGKEALAEIAELNDGFITLRVKNIETKKRASERYVTLYCSVLKKENFELVAQKATEAGVSEIVPISSGRTVKQNINFDRINKIIKEAAEQSGRTMLPVLREPIKLEEAIVKAKEENDVILFCDGSGKNITPLSTQSPSFQAEKMAVFIGPEGGWEEREVAMARDAEFTVVSLGNLTLRGETAAIIASYLAVNL